MPINNEAIEQDHAAAQVAPRPKGELTPVKERIIRMQGHGLEAEIAHNHARAADVLRQEISNDPLGLGYAGKTPEEIAKILNEQCYRTDDKGELVTDSHRFSHIMQGVPYAENAATPEMVAALNGNENA